MDYDSPPSKRQRADTAGDARPKYAFPDSMGSCDRKRKLVDMLCDLGDESMHSILLERSLKDPLVAAKVIEKYEELRQDEMSHVWTNFSEYSDRVEKLFAEDPDLKSPREQEVDLAILAIQAAIADIRKDCKRTSSFGTKKNALEAMRRILEVVGLSQSELAVKMRKRSCHNWVIEMCEILETLTPEELVLLDTLDDGEWLGKLRALGPLDETVPMLRGIEDAYDMAIGAVEEEESYGPGWIDSEDEAGSDDAGEVGGEESVVDNEEDDDKVPTDNEDGDDGDDSHEEEEDERDHGVNTNNGNVNQGQGEELGPEEES